MTDERRDWPRTIPAAAEAAARRWPGETALVDGDQQWTFAELWTDAKATASALHQTGVGHGDCVGIWAPNTREWILAAIGAQCLGAAIVPLNTRLKGGEAADILRRAGVKVLFAPSDFLGQDYASLLAEESLPALVETIRLDTQWNRFIARGAGQDDAAVSAALERLSGGEISDVIYTSGTTGQPKGALTAHEQVTVTFGNWAERVDLREGDRYLIVNPFFHTFGYKAGWVACLLRGATIVPQKTFDVRETVRLIEREQISFIPGPPTIYQSLLQELAGDRQRDFSSLRVAVTGAAPVAPALVDRMRTELGMQNIVNGYGMTECGVIAMTRQGDDARTVAHTCGYPMPGIEVRCVDETGDDVPPGVTGEFWVRGHSVMQGYLDDPVATADAIDADGWLHTGDVGTIDEQGYLAITDRKKDMFISGGFNVYPAEVEKLLAAHPAIEVCAVIGTLDDRLGEVGKAFVVLRPGAQANDSDIMSWARDRMANYKVPRIVDVVGELPRNAAGKVLKTALR
ncbi:FadD3 family acyl-CoA ligase [Parafrankia sp. BMG5.11]|uniref:FadD3 family acyl-CoA ligase n=1 Tax=Parafrankia sp. BMG5.11 TaxID=222540 RepID=UPI00103CD447|nr:FadD3 family acyl-CoA ligase [Parafrankia sp. BMG5.11]TCJ37052.1 fatty acid--CoA ligase [Parafrankia sp. BMG5.11]